MEDDGDSTVCTRGALVCFSSLKKFVFFFFVTFKICLFSSCVCLQGSCGKPSLVNSSTEINEINSLKKKLQTSLCLLDGIYYHVVI